MARRAVQRRLTWLRARLLENRPESSRVHRLVFDVPDWPGHLPGQHLVVRLTAEDGYTAMRSYSVASPPETPELHLLVERLEGNGECVGAESCDGRRLLHFYVDSTTPAHEQLRVAASGWDQGEVTVTVTDDPGWRKVQHLRV